MTVMTFYNLWQVVNAMLAIEDGETMTGRYIG
jgi:hypothetical protein